MKRYVELVEFTAPAGKEYDAGAYPGTGLYRDCSGMLSVVYKLGLDSLPVVIKLGMGLMPILGDIDEQAHFRFDRNNTGTGTDEREATIPFIRDDHRVSVNDLLKAIAISQNPDLAKELIK